VTRPRTRRTTVVGRAEDPAVDHDGPPAGGQEPGQHLGALAGGERAGTPGHQRQMGVHPHLEPAPPVGGDPGPGGQPVGHPRSGPVAEGSVGAGTGTVAFGWKGGIGTSSRRAPAGDSTWTVGVLVQSNFGGDLLVLGVPVGRALGREGVRRAADSAAAQGAKGSIMIVVATDAPLSDRNLRRLAARALVGLSRTGSVMGNGSGDYVIAFSTHPGVRRRFGAARLTATELGNDQMTGLFQGVAEATEEAIYNSLFMATSVSARGGTVEAIPVPEVVRIVEGHGLLKR